MSQATPEQLDMAQARWYARSSPKRAGRRIQAALNAWARTMRSPGDEVDRFIKAMIEESRCAFCGRKLSDPESIANGIGPECAKKTGVDYVQMVLAEVAR